MQIQDIATFLVTFTAVTSGFSLFALLRRFSAARLLAAIVALATLTGSLILATRAIPQVNLVEFTLLAWKSRNLRRILATLLGIAAALPWLATWNDDPTLEPSNPERGFGRFFRRWWRPAVMIASSVAVPALAGVFVWNELNRDARITRAVEPGYTVEEVTVLPSRPIRLVVGDDGRIFVSSVQDNSEGSLGAIHEIELDPATGLGTPRQAAVSSLLIRPNGLAYRNGTLYVSRSGQMEHAVKGVVVSDRVGAVTELKDHDGDGSFTYMHDVISNLPGSQGPDPGHQNNGLIFGPDGSLYITQGDSADRHPPRMQWAGTILRLAPGESEPKVFAQGFRNPFALAWGPDGALFSIDNDVESNPGDELNHVIAGEHYGHPYVVPDGTPHEEGFRDPVHVGGKASHLCGIAYVDPSRGIGSLVGRMLIADLNTNTVFWLELKRSGETYTVAAQGVAAMIPSPLDLAVAPDGNIYVISRFSSKLFRIRPAGAGREGNRR